MNRNTLTTLPRSAIVNAADALSREWLVTNALGGYAAGSVSQANTRRYHGLLVASLHPPVERVVMVAKVDVTVAYAGRNYALATNEFADGVTSPRGFEYLSQFRLDGAIPVWTYQLGDAIVEQRIWMPHGANTSYLSFMVIAASGPLEFELVPLCTYRDYHSHGHGGWNLEVDAGASDCRIVAFDGARPYRLVLDGGSFEQRADWYWRFYHRLEAERGLDTEEDLFRPGVFRTTLNAGESATLTSTADNYVPDPALPALARERSRQEQLLSGVGKNAPQWIRQLTLAADQFIVARQGNDERNSGTTVIAGYPWFSDWGRDTMIALPGLALATGRLDDAAAILRTFANHVSDGMLPNRFPDGNEAPEYNTVDATLWYFHAIDTYTEASGDKLLLAELYPVLQDIIRWHIAGTRYGIGIDERDGLLRAGEKGVQLTWMDAKVGDWVVTPRIGKPVEINALWHYALERMSAWANSQRDRANGRVYAAAAARAAESFTNAFWCAEGGYLFDVVDGPDGEWQTNGRRADKSIRPNQIFAVSLGGELLNPKQQRAVVDTCSRHLLTPMGLRSLSPEDSAYIPRYEGGPWQRDGAYHQGTVWSWLLGPYAIAHQRVFGDADKALTILEQMAPHLVDACIGSISEIFDAAPPHAPRGCFAQAWSVAELLRAWHVLDARRAEQHTRNIRHG